MNCSTVCQITLNENFFLFCYYSMECEPQFITNTFRSKFQNDYVKMLQYIYTYGNNHANNNTDT